MRIYRTPLPVNVDAYQASHFQMIPPGMLDFQVSQGAFRKPLHYGGDERADQRVMSAGMRPFVELNLFDKTTHADVNESVEFYATFHATATDPYHKPYPFPEAMFRRIVDDYGGIMPVVVMAQLDGQSHYVGEPHVQVFCDETGMGECVGWIESTMLPYLWTSSIVATRGRVRKDAWIDVFRKVYPGKTRDELVRMIAYKFHDFGRRGGAASQITGIAHLMNWLGTDTCDSAFVCVTKYNGGRPFGASSIVAGAHRSVTPWPSEDQAIGYAVRQFGNGFFAFVADSYNYKACMNKLAGYAKVIKTEGGFLVGRPDSGDVVQTVIDGLRIFEEHGFGLDDSATAEAGGLKVLSHSGILQGDGVSDTVLFNKLFPAIITAGYSPINLAIGMGEYNHRAVRSDTEHGYKTCVVGSNGLKYPGWRMLEPGYAQVMKGSENLWKRSNPCPVGLYFDPAAHTHKDYRNRVYPISIADLKNGIAGDMKVVYDGRPGVGELHAELGILGRDQGEGVEFLEVLSPVPPTDTFDPRIRKMQHQYMREVGASLSL